MQANSRIFHAQWITTPEFQTRTPINVFHRQLSKLTLPSELPQNRHILFRRSFTLNNIAPTQLYITADDYYKLYINGHFITQGPCPGYHFHYYYNAIEITPYLQPGQNMIAVHTYYQGLINRVWVSGDCRHGLICELESAGQPLLCSDESWLYHEHSGYSECGLSGYATQFLERYDSRAPEIGFEQPEFNDSAWEHARRREHLDYTLFEQPSRQLDIHPIAPASMRRHGRRVQFDFGGMYVGYVSAQARGRSGDEIIIRCGQELLADGSVRYELRANCRYEERWILSGEQDELRQYDYKSFRYAELELPQDCELIEGETKLIARHYPFELSAVPNTSDPELLQVWNLCVRSLQYGVQDVIQDCMEREKGQYLGDGCYSVIAHALAAGDVAIMKKLIEDSLRSGFINKGLMTCSTCSFMQEIADYPLMLPLLVLMYWHITHDVESVADWYMPITELLDFYRAEYENEAGLLADLDKWCVVEWPKEFRDDYDYDLTEGQVCKGVHNVINAYYIGAIKVTNALARIVGQAEYRDTAALIAAYVGAFYDGTRKLFRDSPVSQHVSMPGNMVAFMYGLAPDAETERNMVAMVREKRLSSSMFYITFAMLFGLKRTGNEALLRALIKDEHGWLRMVREGATSTFEGWGKDAKWNTSLFHLTFTYPLIYLTDWGMEELMVF